MRYVIITVAGCAERFNQDAGTPSLKCIFYQKEKRKTLLYSILKKCAGYDKVIVVGGYQYESLQSYIKEFKEEFPFSIETVYNAFFDKYGSGYSLYTGIKACLQDADCTEILFAEGDLAVSEEEFERIKQSDKNCLTVNCEDIRSDKSVVVYINHKNEIKYQYDTSHGFFHITEPFSRIYNSGQIWKMKERKSVDMVVGHMREEEWQGTNLVFVEKYFNAVKRENVEIIPLKYWVNCNTRKDFEDCEGDL